jgi:hypothetical protein
MSRYHILHRIGNAGFAEMAESVVLNVEYHTELPFCNAGYDGMAEGQADEGGKPNSIQA